MNYEEEQHVTNPVEASITEIFEEANQALSDRSTWEEKQLTFYKLRHSGLKRTNTPHPGAADMNWPLSDMMIEKIKPYYIQQTFANELVANFYSLRRSDQAFNTLAAQWFDYRIRQQSNFETEIISVADYMLMTGKGILKIRWDVDQEQVVFDSVDPTMIVVPTGTIDLQSADWLVQIHEISIAAYKRNSLFDDGVLPKITKQNSQEASRLAQAEQYAREGVTHSEQTDQVVLWEVYRRKEDGTIDTFTFSPVYPDEYVRAPIQKIHDPEEFPFVEFNAEIKDKSYYASRGVPERVAAIQMSMSKLWNEKLDAITSFNRPIFTSDNPMANAGNIRMRPGSLIPFPVKKVDMGTPPINWDSELVQHRLTAEQLVGVPDAGLTQIANNERRTASEVNLIGSIMSQVVDLRSRVFRKALAETFRQAWVIYVAEEKERLNYFYQNEMMNLPADAVHPEYQIEPLASADNLNSQFVYRKKVERYNMLSGNPFVNQHNLTRDLIAAGDPQDVKFLLEDNESKAANAAEDQASEISRMLIGFPSQVKPVDDDVTHIMTIKGFVERRVTMDEPISPELATLLVNHLALHLKQLYEKDSEQAAQVEQEVTQLGQYLGTIVGEAGAAQELVQ